jgi:hypothetical protein
MMNAKCILIVIIGFILQSFCYLTQIKYINPDGIYEYGKIVKNEKDQTRIGTLKVYSLSKDRIIVSLFLNRGYPNFNMGTLIDTLVYAENKAEYLFPKNEPTCKINFYFNDKSVKIIQHIEKSECEFGMGVYADGIYKKTSSKRPEIKDLKFD